MLSRLVLGVCASLLLSAVALAQHGAVVHVPADKAAEIMQKGGQVAAAPDATVSFNRRNGPGMSRSTRRRPTPSTCSKATPPS